MSDRNRVNKSNGGERVSSPFLRLGSGNEGAEIAMRSPQRLRSLWRLDGSAGAAYDYQHPAQNKRKGAGPRPNARLRM